MKYKTKPNIVNIVSFDELVEYGITHGANIVNNMPWSFEYCGLTVTHERNDCYILSDGWTTTYFIRENLLVVDESGDVFIIDKNTLEKEYELVGE